MIILKATLLKDDLKSGLKKGWWQECRGYFYSRDNQRITIVMTSRFMINGQRTNRRSFPINSIKMEENSYDPHG